MQTGTFIVVTRDGVIEHIQPKPDTASTHVREPSAALHGDDS